MWLMQEEDIESEEKGRTPLTAAPLTASTLAATPHPATPLTALIIILM
jgi:hypothetical protein